MGFAPLNLWKRHVGNSVRAWGSKMTLINEKPLWFYGNDEAIGAHVYRKQSPPFKCAAWEINTFKISGFLRRRAPNRPGWSSIGVKERSKTINDRLTLRVATRPAFLDDNLRWDYRRITKSFHSITSYVSHQPHHSSRCGMIESYLETIVTTGRCVLHIYLGWINCRPSLSLLLEIQVNKIIQTRLSCTDPGCDWIQI